MFASIAQRLIYPWLRWYPPCRKQNRIDCCCGCWYESIIRKCKGTHSVHSSNRRIFRWRECYRQTFTRSWWARIPLVWSCEISCKGPTGRKAHIRYWESSGHDLLSYLPQPLSVGLSTWPRVLCVHIMYWREVKSKQTVRHDFFFVSKL
jgi:hypothetical protein